MHLLKIFVSLLIGPFRNNIKLNCLPSFRQESEILKENIKNVTHIIKKNVEKKLEDSAIEKIKILNNQLEWLKKNLMNE